MENAATLWHALGILVLFAGMNLVHAMTFLRTLRHFAGVYTIPRWQDLVGGPMDEAGTTLWHALGILVVFAGTNLQ